MLSPKEELRVGAVYTYANQKIDRNILAGKVIRTDTFFEINGDERSSNEEILEGVLLAAQKEYEEKKLKYLGNLYANLPFNEAVDSRMANMLIKIASELTYTNDLLVIHSDDHPVTYSNHNVILLSAEDRSWCQYAYQFAHEYCHFQIGGYVPQQLRWFEESLCELASYFFLPLISDLWKTNPPYPNWRDYAEEFRKYVMLDQQKATPFDLDFSDNPDTLVHLIQNEYDRPKNAYVALKLMPVFEANPQLWSVVHIIRSVQKNLSFSESMRCWRDLSPEAFKEDIDTIAQIFNCI